jgi:glycosyltransferase involved in cell wall biosynthesis
MKLLFLVNGSEQSAAGARAAAFAARLPHTWVIDRAFRPMRKWKGIAPFIRMALQIKPDIIYVMDTAYTGVLAGIVAKTILRCRLVTDTGDLAYELARSSGGYSVSQLALIRRVEQMALRWSDCIVVRGSYHKTLLHQQGVRRCVFIPDGVDLTATVPPEDTAELRRELELGDSLVIGMVGSMVWIARHGFCYGWDIVEALGLLRDVNVKALLIGDGDGRAKLARRAEELGVSDRVVFTGTLPLAELNRYIGCMDVCVSTQSNDAVGMVRTTGKLPLYLALGRYVMATDVGEASRVLPGVGCLLPYQGVRDDEHPARMAAQIRQLLAAPQLLKAEGARRIAAECFDYDLLAARLETLCLTLVPVKLSPRDVKN